MVAMPSLEEQMKRGEALDIRAVNFLGGLIGPEGENWHREELSLADWEPASVTGGQLARPGLPGGTLPDAVTEYVGLFEAHVPPPPIIAHKPRDWEGRFKTVDGHLRCTAAKLAGRTSILAYVVDLDERERDNQILLFDMTATANDAINGHRNSETDRRLHIEESLTVFPDRTNKATAKALRASESLVSDVRNIIAVKARLDALGELYDGVPETALKHLHSVSDDSVLVKALEICVERRVTADQAFDMVKDAKQGTSEQARLERLEEYAKRPALAVQKHEAEQGKPAQSHNGTTRRPARPYWVRALDEGKKFAHKLTGNTDIDPASGALLRDLVVEINIAAKRLLPDADGTGRRKAPSAAAAAAN